MTDLANIQEDWETVMEQDGVRLSVYTYPRGGKCVIVEDSDVEHYKIQLFPTAKDELSISIAAEVTPGRLANFTYDLSLLIKPDDALHISDDGLLTVMARQQGAQSLNLCFGLTLQLTPSYVQPMRKAIELARSLANAFQ